MLKTGTVIDGKYKILNQIGHGGMSTVYLAMNEKANKPWAIKEVRKEGVFQYEVVRNSLATEIEMLKKLKHPYLPSIIDVIDKEDSYLIVMDYIEGNTLLRVMEEYGVQPPEYVIEWGKQLCEVLGYLHTRKPPIVYRDLKPSNIMLKPNGTIALIDFGTAREYKENHAEDTTCLGTHGYAAPEQFGGLGQTDARTDIYCLGMTLYHLLTGCNPCEPPYEIQPIRELKPEISEGIEKIILKCTRRNPEERYQNCDELLYALEHYEEFDIRYRKKQWKKLALFLTSAVAAIGLTITAGAMKYLEKHTAKNHYQEFIDEAGNQLTPVTMEETYRMAISLQPEDETAYIDLLQNVYLADDIFSEEEDIHMREILLSDAEGITYEKKLKRNKKGYARFAYQMGITYFYFYEDAGNRTLSLKWFEAALNSGELNEQQETRSRCLTKIAEYYSKLGKVNKSGDSAISYRDYWNDLASTIEGNIVASDNMTTAFIVYREVGTQIYNHAAAFKKSGVTETEMKNVLSEIQNHINKDVTEVPTEGRNQELYIQVNENIEHAYQAIENAFHAEK